MAQEETKNTELAELGDESAQEIQIGADASDDDALEGADSLTFSNGVIEKIVAIAVQEVPGVLEMKGGWANRFQEAFGGKSMTKGVTVEVAPDNGVRVNIAVLIEYGAYAPQIFEDVKKVVVEHVSQMTGLEVSAVNLRIEDVLTPEEVAERQMSDDDEVSDNSETEE